MSETLIWDENIFKVADVKQWISSCFEDKPPVSGPIKVFRLKTWSITASFEINGAIYVFKGCTISLYNDGPLVDTLLERHCPEYVTGITKAGAWKNNLWLLYPEFKGEPLAINNKDLEDLTLAIADIQNRTAFAYDKIIFQLKHTTITSISHHVHRIQDYVQDAKVSPEIIRALWDFRPAFKLWISILKYTRIPHGVDHRDLGVHNAIRKSDGNILIYGWQESIISCPFFSLERLLVDARELDIKNGEIEKDSLIPYSPYEETILNLYIENMRWKHPKALTLAKVAIGLSYLKSTFENILLLKRLKLPPTNPFHNFPLILARWNALNDLKLVEDHFIPSP